MPNFGSLLDDHDVMDKLADRLVLVARAQGVPVTECATLLAELTRCIEDHLADEALFLQAGKPTPSFDRFAVAARAFREEFASIMESFDGYFAKWDEDTIAADRAGFAQATLDMMTVLKHCIVRENSVLYPLALESGRLKLRSGS